MALVDVLRRTRCDVGGALVAPAVVAWIDIARLGIDDHQGPERWLARLDRHAERAGLRRLRTRPAVVWP